MSKLPSEYEAALDEIERLREGLRNAKRQHLSTRRLNCNCLSGTLTQVAPPNECDCGITEHNAQIDALLDEEGEET